MAKPSRNTAQPLAGLEIAPLAHEELLVVQARAEAGQSEAATEGAPIGLRELARLPLVIPSRPNAIRMHLEAELAASGLKASVALEIDGVAAILDLVAEGAGAAVLSRHAVASAARPQAFAVRRIAGRQAAPLTIALFTAVSALRPATQTQQQVLALVRRLAAERLGAPEQVLNQ